MAGLTRDAESNRPMRTHVVARKTHKWLGLFIGLQVVIWSLSGLYMTVVSIDIIPGNGLLLRVFTWGRFADGAVGRQDAALCLPEGEKEGGAGMTVKSIWLCKIHKWVGLAIGLQFAIWAEPRWRCCR